MVAPSYVPVLKIQQRVGPFYSFLIHKMYPQSRSSSSPAVFFKKQFWLHSRNIGNTSIVCVLWVKYVNLSVGAVQRFVFISHDCQGTLALLWPQELSLNPGLCLSPELELSVPAPKDLQLQPGPCPAALSLLQRKEEVMHTYISLQQAGY